MATIKDVAKLAGVSYTTVSHVINNTRTVADETRQKVLDAIAELNYILDSNAQGLRKKLMRTIGVIGPCSVDHFFAEVVSGIEEACYKNNYNVFLCYSETNKDKELSYINSLIQRNVDGLILDSVSNDEVLFDELKKINKPVALFQRYIEGLDISFYESDDYDGAKKAIEYLIGLGHKKIAYVYGFTHKSHTARQRIFAYKDVLLKNNIDFDESLFINGEYCIETAYRVTKNLLLQENKPTAIFYFSDFMAISGIRAAIDLGIKIPEELSIIGYDDVAISAFINPRLTTVRQDKYEIGKLMAENLIKSIENKTIINEKVKIPVELIIRESTVVVNNKI